MRGEGLPFGREGRDFGERGAGSVSSPRSFVSWGWRGSRKGFQGPAVGGSLCNGDTSEPGGSHLPAIVSHRCALGWGPTDLTHHLTLARPFAAPTPFCPLKGEYAPGVGVNRVWGTPSPGGCKPWGAADLSVHLCSSVSPGLPWGLTPSRRSANVTEQCCRVFCPPTPPEGVLSFRAPPTICSAWIPASHPSELIAERTPVRPGAGRSLRWEKVTVLTLGSFQPGSHMPQGTPQADRCELGAGEGRDSLWDCAKCIFCLCLRLTCSALLASGESPGGKGTGEWLVL